MKRAEVILNQNALSHNLRRVKQLAPSSKIVSMVKANAYGCGFFFALAALRDSDVFGVACLQEALEIRALNCQKSVLLVEGVFNIGEWELAILNRFECVIQYQQQVDWALKMPKAYQQKGLKLWLKINTGMNRLGFSPEQALIVAEQLRAAGFELILTMHFANADQPNHPLNQTQIQSFLNVKTNLNPIQASCCNSAAIFNWPELHFDYVRPGIMLYGASPFTDQSTQELGIKTVMTLQSSLMAIHDLQVGEFIGYGSIHKTVRPTRLGIVAMGYGDGYPRAVNKAFVSIRGQHSPLIGRVSMDMLAIDLTDLPVDIDVGEPVVLWGKYPSIDDIAACNNTIGYELLCKVTARPARIMV